MPTRNISLTEELERFIAKKIETGRYKSASEVVCAALCSLQREEQAIDEGDASGIAKGNLFARVRKALQLSATTS